MQRLDIDALRSLVAVAAFAGVGRAAAALHVSQPTVSGHLRRLEAELGVDLVERIGRGIALTPAGDELTRHAHRIVALHDDAVEAVSAQTEDDLVIAASDLATTPMLVAAADVLRAHHPGRRIRLRTHRSEHIRELLHRHRVDVALTFAAGLPGAERVADIGLTWYGSSAHSATPASDLVVFTKPCTLRSVILDSAVGSAGTIRRECLDLLGVLDAVRAGVGITALPPSFANAPGLLPLPGLEPPSSMELRMVTGPRIGAALHSALSAALAGRAPLVAA
ncbi:LysR family transcriptional regulator [Microbacterium sp. ZW T5_45]|uniref:LysR family transcriptional regulator n=1 Tax=Microbacterium sp. ZW T5_45 TaxID=3378080 RepID=UPI0038540EAF